MLFKLQIFADVYIWIYSVKLFTIQQEHTLNYTVKIR